MIPRGMQTFAHGDLFDPCCEEEDVVEIPLLLPNWQAEALECVAHQQGLTAGEMIRHMILDFLARNARR